MDASQVPWNVALHPYLGTPGLNQTGIQIKPRKNRMCLPTLITIIVRQKKPKAPNRYQRTLGYFNSKTQ